MNKPGSSPAGKITFIGHEATLTGAPILLLHLAAWLKQNGGLEIEFLMCKGGPLLEDYRQVAPVCVLHHNLIEKVLHRFCRLLRRPPPAWISPAAKCARYLRRHRPALLYANTVAVREEVAAMAACGIPVLWHIHEMPLVIEHITNGKGLQAAAGQAELFIAVSEATKRGLSENSVSPEKIRVIPGFVPPVKTVQFDPAASRAEVRRELNLPADAFVAGMCGTVCWRKGFDWFIATAREVAAANPRRDIRFVWIGAPENEFIERDIRFELRSTQLAGRVQFIGVRKDARPYLAALDAFLLSSREDSFPLVMLEAASLGLPIVYFDGTGGAAEFAADDAGIGVAYGDVPAAARALIHLAGEPALQEKLGGTGRERVRAGFTLDLQAAKILAVIKELLGRKTNRP